MCIHSCEDVINRIAISGIYCTFPLDLLLKKSLFLIRIYHNKQ